MIQKQAEREGFVAFTKNKFYHPTLKAVLICTEDEANMFICGKGLRRQYPYHPNVSIFHYHKKEGYLGQNIKDDRKNIYHVLKFEFYRGDKFSFDKIIDWIHGQEWCNWEVEALCSMFIRSEIKNMKNIEIQEYKMAKLLQEQSKGFEGLFQYRKKQLVRMGLLSKYWFINFFKFK